MPSPARRDELVEAVEASASTAPALAQPQDASVSWPQGVSHEPVMKIGEVVDRLRSSFPALSISKVRYLESEGLIHPHRVGNGYRQYSKADVERLRFALTAQRDEYLPLSVIRERLEALDAGQSSAVREQVRVVASHGEIVDGGPVSLAELMRHCGASETQINELIAIGIIAPDARGRFDARCVKIATLAMRAHREGMPVRNLRTVRVQADRLADSIEQAVAHRRSRSDAAGDVAAHALAAALSELHAALMHRAVDTLA